jgi:NitT/TauT family transport system ATP-binding protein
MSRGAPVELHGVSKRFDNGVQALGTIDFALRPGEFVSIVGPSGCGKSTLLRIVAGLVQPSTGRCVRPEGIETAFVFQEAALLPWRTVERNAQLLMELEGYPPDEYRPRAEAALRLVGLSKFLKAYPHQLSGGMRMRLSLARALALQPVLLLLDEPLAAVDELTREVLQEELLSIWKEVGFTAALVTHNVHEAVYLSDRVLVMSAQPGRVLDVIDVPFGFPRSRELRARGEFAQLTGRVTEVLRAPQPA